MTVLWYCPGLTPGAARSVRDRSPAGTCRHTRADRRARLRRTVLPPPLHPLRSIRRSQGGGPGLGRPIALHTCQLLRPTVPWPDTSAVRSRRTAASAFASESHLRSPGGISGPGLPAVHTAVPPAEHAPRRADLEWRCIGSHAASQARRSARETPSDRSLRGERRRSDGTATTLRSCRADLAAFRARGCRALGTSS